MTYDQVHWSSTRRSSPSVMRSCPLAIRSSPLVIPWCIQVCRSCVRLAAHLSLSLSITHTHTHTHTNTPVEPVEPVMETTTDERTGPSVLHQACSPAASQLLLFGHHRLPPPVTTITAFAPLPSLDRAAPLPPQSGRLVAPHFGSTSCVHLSPPASSLD